MSVRQHTYEERLVTTPIADSESISAPAHRRLGFFGLGSVVDAVFVPARDTILSRRAVKQ